jgi:YfiR/HmsC-like
MFSNLRPAVLAALVLPFALLSGLNVQADASAPEYEIKAAFLYNFAKFVEWPNLGQSGSSTPMNLCVLGRDPFGSILDQSIQGKMINGRLLVINRVTRTEDAMTCQVLFISASEKQRLPEILGRLQKASVLTVGDMGQFTEEGGMIYLKTEGTRVRFDINLAAANRARLKISSKLLQLASAVREKN